jgi:3-hydroxyacyl-CoA dehydrogenase
MDALAAAELVIEAVFEDAEVKAGVFRELDRLLPSGIPLASNTWSRKGGAAASRAAASTITRNE